MQVIGGKGKPFPYFFATIHSGSSSYFIVATHMMWNHTHNISQRTIHECTKTVGKMFRKLRESGTCGSQYEGSTQMDWSATQEERLLFAVRSLKIEQGRKKRPRHRVRLQH